MRVLCWVVGKGVGMIDWGGRWEGCVGQGGFWGQLGFVFFFGAGRVGGGSEWMGSKLGGIWFFVFKC